MGKSSFTAPKMDGAIHFEACTRDLPASSSRAKNGIGSGVCKMVRPAASIVVCLAACLMALPVHARSVKKIVIDATGLSEINNTSHVYESFRPTMAQLRRYFSRAYPVDHYWRPKKFYSPCYATGTVEFSGGNSAAWSVSSSGLAEVVWSIKGRTIVFYPSNGWHDPFAGMYDDEGV